MNKRVAGTIILVFAGFLFFTGLRTLRREDAPALTDRSGVGVSYAVGAFLLPMGALILGLWLMKSPQSKGDDGDG